MPDFLVEGYQPAEAPPPRVDGDVAHVSSIFVPADEVCLHVMTAPSADALRAALERTAFKYERIVEARLS